MEHIIGGFTWLIAFADWVKTDRAFLPHLIMPDTTGFHYINSLLISTESNFLKHSVICILLSFLGGSAGKESACHVGDLDSIPGLGRSPGEGNGYPLQYSGLESGSQQVGHD